ncbi:MAG: hypothetical protein ACKOXP_10170, partial [Flavobacteriales bacterium]
LRNQIFGKSTECLSIDTIKMEDRLKNILKKHASFVDLTAQERTQLAEWCADEQEFQSLKNLFEQVDVWVDTPTDESNTKQRLDQLFTIQYTRENTSSNKNQWRSSSFSMTTWVSLSAVAAILIMTWIVYPTNKKETLAKNEVRMDKKESTKSNGANRISAKPNDIKSTEIIVHSDQNTQEEIHSEEIIDLAHVSEELPNNVDDVDDVAVSAVPSAAMVCSGSTVTLSADQISSYSWTTSTEKKMKDVSSYKSVNAADRKRKVDSFTSFNVKSMPEMLDVLVTAY